MSKENTNIKDSKPDVIFNTVNYTILSILLLVILYPLYFIIISSFSDPNAVSLGNVWFYPVGFNLDGYIRIFEDENIWRGYFNTVCYTAAGTTINVAITMMIAYSLARKTFKLRGAIMIYLLITMYFNGGMIPTYLTVKSTGLENTWWVMVVVGAVNIFNVIIARTFIENNIPEELYEAANIDGCSHFNFFSRIVLPLSKASMAVLILYYGVEHWNDYMKALIYIRDNELYPLQIILRAILIENQMQDSVITDVESQLERSRIAELIKYGVVVVASAPMLILYPFLQKYFAKGVMVGSIKG